MATSRTGTATWKRVRLEALSNAMDQGLTHCPRCRVGLDWEYSKRPNSPEVDHITPHSRGGTDAIENTRIICRKCNQELGGRLNKRARPPVETVTLDASPIW